MKVTEEPVPENLMGNIKGCAKDATGTA